MLKKLASGECSLKVTFWVFGVFGFAVLALITNITHSSLLRVICGHARCNRSVILYFFSNFISIMTSHNAAFRWFLVIHSFMGALFGAYMLMVLRGLWKSAEKYEGSSFWAVSAKFLLVVMALFCLKSII
ncbi:MAG: hypothetical protein J6Y91_02705 [Alphaproteobacteria bacterium]|nr:hypothetical protein [Alphaproteobacteria bacterium]